MKSMRTSGNFSPFEGLRELIGKKKLANRPDDADPPLVELPPTDNEQELFEWAMGDVVPMEVEHEIEWPSQDPHKITSSALLEDVPRQKLDQLVRQGKGFRVSHTPEYMEGVGYNIHPDMSTRLHQGEFAIQAHIDLHGFEVADARERFDFFIKEALRTGKRGVLIVHGRGLSSPERPVLKSKVFEWLTRGHWRKWVVAFCSARLCDGGAGGTYVLLRSRKVTKKMIKKSLKRLQAGRE